MGSFFLSSFGYRGERQTFVGRGCPACIEDALFDGALARRDVGAGHQHRSRETKNDDRNRKTPRELLEEVGRLADAHNLVRCAEVSGHTAFGALSQHRENYEYTRYYNQYEDNNMHLISLLN